MEPRIQYTKTADDVNIAYSVMGDGPPLVLMPGQVSNLALSWEFPRSRAWLERIGRGRTLVRYDGRGTGLSERDIDSYSIDVLLHDLEAVVSAAGVERFDLYGAIFSAAAAIEFAVRQPERVAHLILWCACVRGADFWRSPRNRAIRAVRETDWETYPEAVSKLSSPRAQVTEEEVRASTRMIMEGASPGSLAAFMEATETLDVAHRLPFVTCPTLVAHSRNVEFLDIRISQEIAALIPSAQLAILDDAVAFGGTESLARVIDDFLGVERPTSPVSSAGHGLQTILFTDLEGSTALTDRLGDAAAREVLRRHERSTRQALDAHGGSEVKTMGDGFMASFGSATKALECAMAIQRALTPDPSPAAAGEGQSVVPLKVRCGLNAGEPIAEGDDLHGTAVITAARIAALANGGEILVSDVVRQLVAGKGFLFNDRGDHALKGFEDPVRVWEVRWSE